MDGKIERVNKVIENMLRMYAMRSIDPLGKVFTFGGIFLQ
jgi:hypothetical protein